MPADPEQPRPPDPATLQWLRREVTVWQANGLINAAQADAILSRYPAPDTSAGKNRTIVAFTIIGAVLLALGVLLFIGANWEQMPRWAKLTMLFASTGGSYLLGYWLWQIRGTQPRVGHALVLLGTLLFGASIFLVAQIFHIRAHWPNGFLFWALGALPVAWMTDSRPILATGALLLGLWNIFELVGFERVPWLLPPLLAILVLPLVGRLRAPESVMAATGGLAFWLAGALVLAGEAHSPVGGLMPVSAALALVGATAAAAGLRWWERFGAAPFYSGVALALGSLYIQTFRLDNPWSDYSFFWSARQFWILAGAGLVVGGLLAAGYFTLDQERRRRLNWPLATVSALVVVGGVLPLAGPVARAVTANLLLLAVLAGLIAWGFRSRLGGAVLLGLIGFLVDIITRYFDLFWSLMDRSLFFVLGGLLLLGGGYLMERGRRRWLAGNGEGGA